ncbi:C-Jun-amino-terminal kinase-interacting protein 1 isoform X2 [Lates japonicus]|uniref:C-Jun-amino-terminal kinase-interacting protein 1 isoform X2 n=1 Tax=Lates japonicus TaxID=270547 RepID=A0AAD3R4R9_LATJO|nr:C-Jun-amino-terminal kinase-interacting protein 1 isoform X2 [Lates japonicus]
MADENPSPPSAITGELRPASGKSSGWQDPRRRGIRPSSRLAGNSMDSGGEGGEGWMEDQWEKWLTHDISLDEFEDDDLSEITEITDECGMSLNCNGPDIKGCSGWMGAEHSIFRAAASPQPLRRSLGPSSLPSNRAGLS